MTSKGDKFDKDFVIKLGKISCATLLTPITGEITLKLLYESNGKGFYYDYQKFFSFKGILGCVHNCTLVDQKNEVC